MHLKKKIEMISMIMDIYSGHYMETKRKADVVSRFLFDIEVLQDFTTTFRFNRSQLQDFMTDQWIDMGGFVR